MKINCKVLFKEKGFTLVELLIVVSLASMLAAVMALTYNLINKTGSINNDNSITYSQIVEAGRWITKDVQNADNITGYSENSWNCAMNSYNWNGSSIDTVNIQYVIEQGVLKRVVNQSQPVVIASYLSGPGTDTVFFKSPTEDSAFILKLKVVYNSTSVSKTYVINKRIPGGT